MFSLGDKVKVLQNDITIGDIETIDRIQFYNRGKVGIITHIDDGVALIDAEDVTYSGKDFTISLPIRLTGLERV